MSGTAPTPSEGLRLRPRPGQVLLGAVLLALITALVVNAFLSTSARQSEYDLRLQTESAAANAVFAQRESLNLAVTVERWLAGDSSRRDVQIARALLTQRLSVQGDTGVRAGTTLGPDYLRDLTALDAALATAPAGTLPEGQHPLWRARVDPALVAFTSEARQVTTIYQQEADRRARSYFQQRVDSDQRQAVLLAASLAVALLLMAWLTISLRRRVRQARDLLELEEAELEQARAALHLASLLDRGQAQILERIATGTGLAPVFQGVVDLASSLTGGRAFVLRWSGRVVASRGSGVPIDDETPVLWSTPLGLDRDGVPEGVLSLLGPGEPLDADLRRVCLRCSDLATIALDRERDARSLTHQANHDALTGLANRTRLLALLEETLNGEGVRDDELVLLFCDLDRFKLVNDSLGHDVGDQLLVQVAARLQRAVRGHDLVARFGGDEFVVMCRETTSRQSAIALADRIAASLDAPFVVGGREAFIGVSIGIAHARTGDDPASLLRNADVAMYRAKVDGSLRWTVYDSSMEAAAATQLDLDSALRRAVARGELVLNLQPVVSLPERTVLSCEALVRWQRPMLGLTLPTEFIPAAEENGLVVEIGRWVLHESVAWLAAWLRRHPESGMCVAVNVSGRQLREPQFADDVLGTLLVHDVPPARLTLELTESTLIESADAHRTLGVLREQGVRIALDDFGTGFSSLTQLRSLPVDTIKIDRSFVAPLTGGDSSHAAVIAAVVALGDAMALDLVVEGIETEAECAAVIELGCTRGQGFLFSRPLSPELADQWLEERGTPISVG